MPAKRIVLFTAGHTERNGGLARHSRLLVEGFADDGWDVRAISRAGSLRRPKVTRERAGRRLLVLELPGWDRPRWGAAVYLAVGVPLGALWAARARGCVAVHLGSTTVAAGLAASLWRRPFIALSTSSGSWGEAVEALRCNPAGLRRRVLRRATWLVAQSEATAHELVDLASPGRVAVVPNPLVLPRRPPPLDERPRVLVVGRLAAEKGSLTILDAWRAVIEEMPEASLSFVGIGGSWRSVEDEVRARVAADPLLSTSVTFHGWTDDVSAALATHDVFLIASDTEGMSNSLLEACAHGRVVVASDIPANRAVLGDDHPLCFEPGDAAALSARLGVALRDASVRAEARRGVLSAVTANDIRAVIRRHAALLAASGGADEDSLP